MSTDANPPPVLEIRKLKKYYPVKGNLFGKSTGEVRAVDGVSLTLKEGETLGLVGESGCGKSTICRTALRLVEPTGGRIFFRGIDLLEQSREELRALRQEMQIIFQDPSASLNPRKRIGSILEEPFIIHGIGTAREKKERLAWLLDRVGLSPEHVHRYPHEFSGGQLQRICIARAIALNPRLVVADEPVSALDVSIQAQVLNLLQDLKESMGISYLFISHDMAVVEHFCDRVAVMYLGKIVELAPHGRLYTEPRHPYTEALLAAVPKMQPGRPTTNPIPGDIPSPSNPPNGCAFHTRCPLKEKRCEQETPELKEVSGGHFVACFLRDH